MSKELLVTLLEVAQEALVELLATLDGERVLDRLACEFADDVCRNVQAEDRWERSCICARLILGCM